MSEFKAKFEVDPQGPLKDQALALAEVFVKVALAAAIKDGKKLTLIVPKSA